MMRTAVQKEYVRRSFCCSVCYDSQVKGAIMSIKAQNADIHDKLNLKHLKTRTFRSGNVLLYYQNVN